MTERPRATACPSCGAAARPDAPWCTLCHTDLRPKAPEPVAQPVPIQVAPTAAYGTPAPDPLTAPLLEMLGAAAAAVPTPAVVEAQKPATWPCMSCQAKNPITADTCSVCQQPFLAAMRSTDQPMLVLPVVGDIGKLSRGGRMGLAFGAVAVVLVPLALITLLLTQRPPASTPTQTPTSSVTQPQDSSGGGTVQ